MEILEFILQFLTTLSVFAVTMLSFENIRDKHWLLKMKETLYVSLGFMCVSSILLVCVEHYITAREKEKSAIAQENLNAAQKKINDALEVQNAALKNQLECQQSSDQKADSRHTNDSTYYTNQNNELLKIIYGLQKTSKKVFDTASKTIQEVKKIKTPIIEPYFDLADDERVSALSPYNGFKTTNPYVDFRNDSAIFAIFMENFNETPARNLQYTCIFVHPNGQDLYLGDNSHFFNRNVTFNQYTVLMIPFNAYIPEKLPNAFYIYFKMTYTGLKDTIQQKFERVFYRNNAFDGKKAVDAGDSLYKHCVNTVYHKYPYLRQ